MVFEHKIENKAQLPKMTKLQKSRASVTLMKS